MDNKCLQKTHIKHSETPFVVELTNIITSTGTTKAKIVPFSTDSQHLQKGKFKDAIKRCQIKENLLCVLLDETLPLAQRCCITPYASMAMLLLHTS